MKNIILLLIGCIAMTLSSCGTFAAYSEAGGQRFDDGVYGTAPSFKDKTQTEVDKQNIDRLIQQTKSSPAYLYSVQTDSTTYSGVTALMEFNKRFSTNLTTPYLYYNGPYSYWNNPWYNHYYSSLWGYRGWYDPWHYRHSPWFYGGYYGGYYGRYYSSFYDPWYYGYDPWYYGGWYAGWYDPWYYGGWYAGFCDPFYHYMHPYYCGWYGGWDPYYNGIHFRPPHGGHHIIAGNTNGRGIYRGSRHTTSSGKVVVSDSRTPSKDVSGTVRKTSTTSRTSFGTSRTAASRSATGRSTTTYRKPTTGSVSRSPESSGSSYNRGTNRSSYGTSPSYNRGSGYSTSPSSSYNRSSSGGSYGGGGYSGGSSHGGGGYSRSSSGSRR